MTENNFQEQVEVSKDSKGNKLIIIIAVLSLLFLVTIPVSIYFFYFQNKPDAQEQKETTSSTELMQEDSISLEVPIYYYSSSEDPSAIAKIDTPKGSFVDYDENKRSYIQLPNNSKLFFGIPHASAPKELNLEDLTPIDTINYENTYRYEDGWGMIYSNVTLEGICGSWEELYDSDECPSKLVDGECKDIKTVTIKAPCAYPLFHRMIIYCKSEQEDCSLCDEAMKYIKKILYIYTDQNLPAFEVKYPSDWIIKDIRQSGDENVHDIVIYQENAGAEGPSIKIQAFNTEKTVQGYIDSVKIKDAENWEEFKKDFGYENSESVGIKTVSDSSNSTIEAKKIYRLNYPNSPNRKETQYIFKKNSTLFILSAHYGTYNPDTGSDGTEEKEALDDIFQTFRFL